MKKCNLFNRILTVDFHSLNFGKSVHEYDTYEVIWHHSNVFKPGLGQRLYYDQGYISHFRDVLNLEILNLYSFDFNQLNIDLSYYFCVLKKMKNILQ